MDGFINDIITIPVDDKQWIDRAKSAALLVIHTIFQPLQLSEPLKIYNTLYLTKRAGEGQLDEQKTFLLWDINTHSLRVFTPKDKQTDCTTYIKEALSSTKIKTYTLKLLIWESQ